MEGSDTRWWLYLKLVMGEGRACTCLETQNRGILHHRDHYFKIGLLILCQKLFAILRIVTLHELMPSKPQSRPGYSYKFNAKVNKAVRALTPAVENLDPDLN